ncbi:MAG: methylenetetrahydrofolate reductase [Thermodesulfobacteriota bacterium]
MRLKHKFNEGEFAVLAEIEPPKGVDVSGMIANATRVKGRIDAFLVPEMSNAVMRMSALGASMILQQKGMETVMQVCCRDRNRIALQADLLGAYACGIRNIMAVTGADPSFGDHHQARPVYDITLQELLQAVLTLRKGKDMAGIELQGAPDFLMGSMINAGEKGKSPGNLIDEMNRKTDAGAQFFMTQPLFDLSTIRDFLKQVDLQKIKMIPTVLLLKSVGMARYIRKNVNDIFIPDSLIDRIQEASDKVRECIQIASELITAFNQEGFSGVLISTLGWEDRISDILDERKG